MAEFLGSLGLGELAGIFDEEALTLDILIGMVRDGKSLWDSLKETGVSRLGHPEKDHPGAQAVRVKIIYIYTYIFFFILYEKIYSAKQHKKITIQHTIFN